MEKTSSEISNEIAELEKKLKSSMEALHIVTSEKLEEERKILNLRSAIGKARHNIAQLRLDIRLKEKEFWSSRNSGL